MVRTVFALIVSGVAATLGAAPASALTSRTFVSGTGVDSGGCGRAAPCRTFAYAITQTSALGEIVVLDSAGYGTIAINKSISIINPAGVEAGISAASGQPAITIDAFSGSTIALRGLTLEGQGTASDGIVYRSGGRIEITDCVIRNFTHDGIYMPIGQSGGFTPNTLVIRNTTASDNGSSGIEIVPALPFIARGVIDGVHVNGNGQSGLFLSGANTGSGAFVDIAVTRAVADSNAGDGFTVNGAGNVKVEIKDSLASNNGGNGLTVSNAKVGLSTTALVVNTAGFSIGGGGTITTFGDNIVENNRNANVGTLTPVSRQ